MFVLRRASTSYIICNRPTFPQPAIEGILWAEPALAWVATVPPTQLGVLTHVLAHTGLTNARMRIHLGLSGLDGVYIRVGDSTRQWRDGRCIVFDDSFVHEVWHNGTQTRIVLIVDIWHVEMDEAARQASILASSERDELVAAYQNNRAQFGPDNWF